MGEREMQDSLERIVSALQGIERGLKRIDDKLGSVIQERVVRNASGDAPKKYAVITSEFGKIEGF